VGAKVSFTGLPTVGTAFAAGAAGVLRRVALVAARGFTVDAGRTKNLRFDRTK